MLKNKSIIALLGCCILGTASCKKFLDVNTNPNVAHTVTMETMLPAAQLYVGSALGCDLNLTGAYWVQYWTQSPSASQYVNLDKYSIGQDQWSAAWRNLYYGAENFYQLSKLADSQKSKQYKAISLLMSAYTFQLITDGWGDVPYREALNGQPSDGYKVNPKYDSQLVVYNGILNLIDSANKYIDVAADNKVQNVDLVYQGNMSKWLKFSNTLKLKTLMRMLNRNTTGVTAAINTFLATGPDFIGSGDGAMIYYGGNTNSRNPMYDEEYHLNFTQNFIASKTSIDSLLSNNDYRIGAFYNTNAAGGFAGIPQGLLSNNFTVTSNSTPSSTVGADPSNSASANAPVIFISASESYFLQAEAIVKGFITGDDSAMYYQGVYESFSFYGSAINSAFSVSADTAYGRYVMGEAGAAPGYWAVYPTHGTSAARLQFIATQKWFSMNGNQGYEAWCEYRRTGYPDFLTIPLDRSNASVDHPARLLYPTTESNVNANYPGLQLLNSKVWWAK